MVGIVFWRVGVRGWMGFFGIGIDDNSIIIVYVGLVFCVRGFVLNVLNVLKFFCEVGIILERRKLRYREGGMGLWLDS